MNLKLLPHSMPILPLRDARPGSGCSLAMVLGEDPFQQPLKSGPEKISRRRPEPGGNRVAVATPF